MLLSELAGSREAIYLDGDLALSLGQLAVLEGRSQAELIRDVLYEFPSTEEGIGGVAAEIPWFSSLTRAVSTPCTMRAAG